MDQRHPLRNMRGLPEADRFFPDPRFRELAELIYPDHAAAYGLIFERGVWNRVNFVFDEDDDCGRWERVDSRALRVSGRDAIMGDSTTIPNRTPRETEANGIRIIPEGGKLYISRFDGRLHLYGAETGTVADRSEYDLLPGMGSVVANGWTRHVLRRFAIRTRTGMASSILSNTTWMVTIISRQRSICSLWELTIGAN